jgi:hypothetical protein
MSLLFATINLDGTFPGRKLAFKSVIRSKRGLDWYTQTHNLATGQGSLWGDLEGN